MNEMTKTLVFCIAAFVAIGIGVASRPSTPTADETIREMIGKPLFAELDEPEKAASLEITEFDENVAERSTFKVARDRVSKRWVIPSHYQYPADADTQMRDAALALIDLKVLDVASRVKEDHEIYGVVAPDDELKASTKGVGKLAIVKDAEGNSLAEIIIGKAVKGSDGQRFVRRHQQDPVYVVAIDPTKLPTDFEKWIEKDLLQTSAIDLESLNLRDFSVVPTLNSLMIDNRLQIKATYSQQAGKWQLDEMLQFKGREGVPTQLLEEEELNTSRLNEVKDALDQLEIVDVVRKPAGLGGDLKASDEFMSDPANRDDLAKRGFYVVKFAQSEPFVVASANGEIQASTKEGVRYILRFGNTTGTQDEKGQLNRYLFVTAEIDYDKIPAPIVTPLPIKVDAPADAPAETGLDEGAKLPDRVGPLGKPKQISDPDELAAERERITKENNRQIDEYNEKVEKAQTQVRELQQRFADWYYVISDDVYKKIHLGRSEIIQERKGDDVENFGIDAFRALELQGLEGKPAPTPPAPRPGVPGGIPSIPGLGR